MQRWRQVVPHLLAAFLQIVCAFAQGSDVKHWELGLVATDADLSPDDRFIGVTLETPIGPQKAREPVAESIQVWDYQQGAMVRSTQLATYLNIQPHPNVARFTADGLLLVASEPTKLHVLEASSLKLLRIIEPPLDQDFRIFHIETEPIGHIAVVGANRDLSAAEVFAYDLDSGGLLFQSKLPHGVSSIAWKQDGTQFAVATPFPCTRFTDTVYVFEASPWHQLRTLAMRNPSTLTFSLDRLYIVQTSACKGSVSNRHLGLQAFDLRTWNRLEALFLPRKDIHGSVSYAGRILVANTGEIKTKFDWLDVVTYTVSTNVEFTAWEGDARSQKFTFAPSTVPPHRGPGDVPFRLSRTGRMILLKDNNPQVFQIP